MTSASTTLSIGDRVSASFQEGLCHGSIKRIIGRKARVEFDDGDVMLLNINDLVPQEIESEDEEEETQYSSEEFEPKGFNLYPIKWDNTNFGVDIDDSRFFGCWRKTVYGNEHKQEGYAIDIWAKYKGHDYSVESIPYLEFDPLNNLKSLNSDICAAISKFMYLVDNDLDTVESLRKKAARPRVHISRIETMDRLILRLQEIRDVAIRSGGQRICTVNGDRDGDPVMGIIIDVTAQARLLEGKVPSLLQGAIYDQPAGKGGEGRAITHGASKESINALIERLRVCKSKPEARKIRAILRRMGHRGGARSISAVTTTEDIDNNEDG